MPDLEGLVLAYDYGLARIGVAVGQALTNSAQPLAVVSCSDGHPDWAAMDRLCREWRPTRLLVGKPLNLDDSESAMSRAAAAFAETLAGRYGLPVSLHDERLSSREARQRFAERRASGLARAGQAGAMDAIAAAVILESWLGASAPVRGSGEAC